MIPQSFEEWKNCIVHDCKVNLTQEYAQKRLAVYQDRKNRETQKFVTLYGEDHLQNVINWLTRI